ncbi:MAG: alpha-L-arabinofuranosidase C-terminal domain-containing protein, partial [Acidimicrobiales bacterium]
LYTGSDDYWTNQLAPHATERAIETTVALLKRAAYNQKLDAAPRIVYDEWNVWFRDHTGSLEERYVFHDALAVGTYLNVFVRNCAWVTMANLAQMVNAIAPIVTTPETVVVQPIYYPFLLHAQGHLTRAVDAFVEGPVVEAPAEQLSRWPHRVDDLGPFSLVDAAATVDEGMTKLACTLVNRSEEPEEVELSLRSGAFTGAARLRTVTGTGRRSPVPGVEEADVSEGSETSSGSSVTLVLPARSFTLVEVALARA